MIHRYKIFLLFIFSITIPFSNILAENIVRIVGSASIFPYTTTVAEVVNTKYKDSDIVIEATGTGGGIALFCAGEGYNFPDIVAASRPMRDSEFKKCHYNGITNITEINLGYDALVIIDNKDNPIHNLTTKDLGLALIAKTPNNPYNNWQQINKSLPDSPITIYGPHATSGKRETLDEKIIIPNCHKISSKSDCLIREDGHFVEIGDNDNMVIQKITNNKTALGIISYGYYIANNHQIASVAINNISPSPKTVADKTYPLARTLYLYVKDNSLKHNKVLQYFITEITSNEAIGENGYLTTIGLVPMSKQ